MKIKTVPTTRFALISTALVVAWFTLSNSASAVGIRDAHELGLMQLGASARHGDGSTYINNLIGMALSSSERANQQYVRTDTSAPRVLVIDRALNRRETITMPSIGVVPGSSWVNSTWGRVPDGGITAMLLGAALGALGIARRYLRT